MCYDRVISFERSRPGSFISSGRKSYVPESLTRRQTVSSELDVQTGAQAAQPHIRREVPRRRQQQHQRQSQAEY